MMRALAVAVLTLFGVGGSGAVVASGNSLPGEVLYPVKQAIETARVTTALSPESKAATHFTIAEEKLREVEALQERRGSGEGIATAAEQLARHQAAAEERLNEGQAQGKDVEALVAKLQANAQRQQGVLARVLEQVPDQAKGAIRHAIDVSQRGLKNAAEQQTKPKGPERAQPGGSEGAGRARGNPSSADRPAAGPGAEEGRGRPADLPRGR